MSGIGCWAELKLGGSTAINAPHTLNGRSFSNRPGIANDLKTTRCERFPAPENARICGNCARANTGSRHPRCGRCTNARLGEKDEIGEGEKEVWSSRDSERSWEIRS